MVSGTGDNLHSMFEGKFDGGSIKHINQTNLFHLPLRRLAIRSRNLESRFWQSYPPSSDVSKRLLVAVRHRHI